MYHYEDLPPSVYMWHILFLGALKSSRWAKGFPSLNKITDTDSDSINKQSFQAFKAFFK